MNSVLLIESMFKCHLDLDIHFLKTPDDNVVIDRGFREAVFSKNKDFVKSNFSELFRFLEYKNLHIMEDNYKLQYMFFKIKQASCDCYVAIGPYLGQYISQEDIKKISRINSIQSKAFDYLKNFYGSLPVMMETKVIQSASNLIKHYFEDEGDYSLQYISAFPSERENFLDELDAEESQAAIDSIEKRYYNENLLLRDIERGDFKNASESLAKLMSILPNSEYLDDYEKFKTSMTISNVLLRKSVEKVGVHPYYIDKISRMFAEKIQSSKTKNDLKNLGFEMTKSYCDIVNSFRINSAYSPVIKNAIRCINTNINKRISLSDISELLNINKNYLSSLFKKETGMTVTEYSLRKKMDMAKELIDTTNLLISDIAILVGVDDVSYFTKLYKKVFNTTPSNYKASMKDSLK